MILNVIMVTASVMGFFLGIYDIFRFKRLNILGLGATWLGDLLWDGSWGWWLVIELVIEEFDEVFIGLRIFVSDFDLNWSVFIV